MIDLQQLLVDRLIALANEPRLPGIPFFEFCDDVLKLESQAEYDIVHGLWDGQRRVAELVTAVDEQGYPLYSEVCIGTGHSIGKTFLAGTLVCWWLASGGNGTTIITSAPTNRQVEHQLWKEINTLWSRSHQLMNLCQPLRKQIEISRDWVAYGFTTDEPGKFQGVHAPRLRVLIDEANGFPENLWQAINVCTTGANTQTVSMGNCVTPLGHFYNGFSDSQVKSLKISSREHPNVIHRFEVIPGAVTHKWIKDFERKYKSIPDLIKSRIDAIFPTSAYNSVFTQDMFDEALNVEVKTTWPCVYSVDVARYGDNLTVVSKFRGQEFMGQQFWGKTSLVETANRVAKMARDEIADYIVVDDDGVGGGVTDILTEEGFTVLGFKNGGKATQEERFCNLITEAYWLTREAFEGSFIHFAEENLTLNIQLVTRAYLMDNKKRFKIESKDDYTKRTELTSPDFADSFVMGVWAVVSDWIARSEMMDGF